MARVTKPLTQLEIQRAKPKEKMYKLFDGNGLYLEVKPNGSKIWRVKYRINGKEKSYTIGNIREYTLQEVREITHKIRRELKDGIDPVIKRRAKKNISKRTFGELAQKFIDKKSKDLALRTIETMESRLRNYALPLIGNKPLESIAKADIVKVVKEAQVKRLSYFTGNKIETSKRVFILIKQILEFGVHNDYLKYNIASTIDIKQILPKVQSKHFRAITDINELRELYKAIKDYSGIVGYALLFTLYTALRVGNIRALRWEYIDFDKRVITFPADTMKTREEFRLPLSSKALEVIEEIKTFNINSLFVFPSPIAPSKQMSENTLNYALKRMDFNTTAHGLRSSFSTICYEHQREHGFSSKVIETQLAHRIGSKVARAYLRSDFLEERRELVEWWSSILENNSNKNFN